MTSQAKPRSRSGASGVSRNRTTDHQFVAGIHAQSGGQPRQDLIDDATKELGRFLKVLDDHLQGRTYLVGDSFTIGDLNVASILSFCQLFPFSFEPHANVQRWLDSVWNPPGAKTDCRRDGGKGEGGASRVEQWRRGSLQLRQRIRIDQYTSPGNTNYPNAAATRFFKLGNTSDTNQGFFFSQMLLRGLG